MKFVFLSDTHGTHAEMEIPLGDFLIFCGDMSSWGELREIAAFALFLKNLPHTYKIVIAGNHDFSFEDDRRLQAEELIRSTGAYYLNDSGVHIGAIKFWGSPVQPYFRNMAFNRRRGEDIRKHWELIPSDTDILITHGPPKGILDTVSSGEQVGCEELLQKTLSIHPKIHVFGHIHEGYGTLRQRKTVFINASNLNVLYQHTNPPLEWEWPD